MFWRLSYREARGIATITAGALWALAAVFLLAGAGHRSIAGPLKTGDFVFFYTLGDVARAGDRARAYDVEYLHERQSQILPESAREQYLPVYPPQSYFVYWPMTWIGYTPAAVLWGLLIVAGYAWVLRGAWRASRDVLPDGRFLAIAAAAFPPFWNLVLHLHNTILPLAAFFLCWLALMRGRRFLAGLALGLLFFKPTFGLVLAVFVLCGREWAMLGGLAVAAAVQLGAIATVFEPSVLSDYVQFMRAIAPVEYLIEPKPFELHSIRALTRFAPGWLGTALWLAASAVVVERAWRVWRREDDAGMRVGVLILASVLVSPHLFLYDATVLAPALVWIGAWVQRQPSRVTLAARYWGIVVALFAAFLLPFARITFVQVSVLLMIALLFVLANVKEEGEARSVVASAPQPASS